MKKLYFHLTLIIIPFSVFLLLANQCSSTTKFNLKDPKLAKHHQASVPTSTDGSGTLDESASGDLVANGDEDSNSVSNVNVGTDANDSPTESGSDDSIAIKDESNNDLTGFSSIGINNFSNSPVDLRTTEPTINHPVQITQPKDMNKTIQFLVTNDYEIDKDTEATKQRLVDIFILLDVSGSMMPNLETVRDNLITFFQNSQSISPRIGLIPFIDEIITSKVVPLSSVPDPVLTSLKSYSSLAGGGDPPEGGLIAIKKAVQMFTEDLATTPDRANAAKIILTITDIASHDGDQNNLTIVPTVTAINQLVSRVEAFGLFYSVPDNVQCKANGENEINFPLPQYVNIMNQISKDASKDIGGDKLNYPFDATTFLDDFINQIKLTFTTTEKLRCFIEEASLVYNDLENTEPILFPNQLAKSIEIYLNKLEVAAFDIPAKDVINDQNKNFTLHLTRCCGVLKADSTIECIEKREQALQAIAP